MTRPYYASAGCAAESQVHGSTPNPDYSWGVNFNNGNSNNLNPDNHNYVRAVRASESPHAVTFHHLRAAWKRARSKKQPSRDQLSFESFWADGLLDLADEINALTWTPGKTTCFVATRPKAREIHAPAFRDRIVHHWLVPQLEAIWDRTFIHDAFSNRTGKGTHAAVARLRDFMREVHSGQGGGYYLQLDIKNFFNTIYRPRLWELLKRGLVRAGVSAQVQHVTHALVRQSSLKAGVVRSCSAADHALVPTHKRLDNAGPGRGLPIGNLSSQFFANVYLDRLDQFVKHTLKAQRYVRYVDDFVLVHRDRAQLEAWLQQIRDFLTDALRLELKADIRLRPLSAGVDFLGYHCFPTHTRIRRRVVAHATESLASWERRHVRGDHAVATPAEHRLGRSIWASYEGHLKHGNAHRLRGRLLQRFPWLHAIALTDRSFDYRLEGRPVSIPLFNRE